MPKLGTLEIVVILIAILLIFGPKNLPKLGSALGKSVKNLREGMGGGKKKDVEEAKDDTSEADDSTVKTEKADDEEVDAEEVVPDKPAPKSQSKEE